MQYLTIIERAGNNLSAWFPDVPGCGTVGGTVEEVMTNACEALELHLDDEPEGELPAARPLKAIIAEGLELDGSEIVAWVTYERHALAPA
jgi:predicted RNase H-like HicB family nuclease